MKTKPSSIEEIRQRTRNLIEDHEKSIRQFHEKHFPHLCEREEGKGRMSDEESFSEGYDEAAMAALEVQEKESARLREENARLREAVKNAYYEGWQDNASVFDTAESLRRDWEASEACAAIREGERE